MTEIVDNPKGKSDVWKVFGFKKIDGKVATDKAICRLCNFEYFVSKSHVGELTLICVFVFEIVFFFK
jgi:hypothetical protein